MASRKKKKAPLRLVMINLHQIGGLGCFLKSLNVEEVSTISLLPAVDNNKTEGKKRFEDSLFIPFLVSLILLLMYCPYTPSPLHSVILKGKFFAATIKQAALAQPLQY